MSQRILVIDSDTTFAEQLGRACFDLGLAAETVADGTEGIQLAQLDAPLAVVLGIMDGKGSGYSLCSKLRKRVPEVPVLMAVDKAEHDSDRLARHRGLRTKADDYLSRPFSLREFLNHLNPLLPEPLAEPDCDLDRVVGEITLGAESSLIGAGLFDEDELAEIEAEADQAFESLVSAHAALEGDAIEVTDDLVEDSLSVGEEPDEMTAVIDMGAMGDLMADARFDAASDHASEEAASDRDQRSLRAQVIQLQQELKLAQEELARRRQEATEKRQSGSAARRELLEAREEVNKRERTVSELRDKISARDRELLGRDEELEELRTEKERLGEALRTANAKGTAVGSAREEAEAEVESLKVRLSELKVRLDQQKDETEKTYAEIKELKAKAEADLAAAANAHGDEIASLKRAHGEAVDRLKDEHVAARRGQADRHQEEVDGLNGAHAAALEALKKEHSEAHAASTRAHADTIADLETQHEEASSAAAEAHAAATEKAAKALAETEAALEGELDAAKAAHAQAVSAAEEAAAEAAAAAEAKDRVHAEAVEKAAAEHTEVIEGLKVEHAEALATVNKDHAEETAKQKADQDAFIEAMEADHEEVAADLKSKLEAEQKAHTDAREAAAARAADLEGQLAKKVARAEELDRTVAQLTADLTTREADLKGAKEEIGDGLDTIKGLESSLSELRIPSEERAAAVEKARTALGVAQAFLERAGVEEDDASLGGAAAE